MIYNYGIWMGYEFAAKADREKEEAKQLRKIAGKLISCSGDCISFSPSAEGR